MSELILIVDSCESKEQGVILIGACPNHPEHKVQALSAYIGTEVELVAPTGNRTRMLLRDLELFTHCYTDKTTAGFLFQTDLSDEFQQTGTEVRSASA